MKRLFLISTCFLIIGAIIAFIGFALAGCSFSKMEKMKKESYDISEHFSFIDIDSYDLSADIIIKSHKEATTKLELYYPERDNISYFVSDGKLTVTNEKTSSWISNIFNFGNASTITLYLPEREYERLNAKSSSGDVTISDLTLKNLSLHLSGGDVNLDKVTAYDTLTATTSSGDYHINLLNAGSIHIKSSSGEMEIENSTFGEFELITSSGDVELSDLITHGSGKIDTSSGDISIERTILASRLTVESSSGDVEFSGLDASEIYVNTSSGDVSGSVLSAKNFVADTSSGEINLPSSDTAKGIFKIKTSSGDIKIKIKN